MGRKGGGKAGFMKAARVARPDGIDDDREDNSPAPAPAEAPSQPQQSKAAAFLKDAEPPAADGEDSSEEEGEPGVETRGKMLQRHKRVRRGGAAAGTAANCCRRVPAAAGFYTHH